MPTELERRRSLLTAALGFALVDTQGMPAPKEIQLVREWLDNWKGLGHVVVGMERQGYALSLTKITGDGWRATFHSNPQLSADGFATDAKPWRGLLVSCLVVRQFLLVRAHAMSNDVRYSARIEREAHGQAKATAR